MTNGVQLKKNQHFITFGVSYLINFVAGILQDHYIKYEKEDLPEQSQIRRVGISGVRPTTLFMKGWFFCDVQSIRVIMSWNDCKLDTLTYHRNRRSVVTSKPPLKYYIGKKSESLFNPGEHSGKYTGEADLYKVL